MNAATQFPWAMIVFNAVWICGLAVILAALGWRDNKRRERASDGAAGFSLRQDGRGLKTAAVTKAESLMKPILPGLIMVAGGAALSVGSPLLAAIFAIAAFGLVIIFVKRFVLGNLAEAADDKDRAQEGIQKR
jgi:membrane protein implicated in regulation of membrane protease activity